MKSRRAQAAMEFLTTYGWVLIVIIAVIGGMTYFIGIDNIQSSVPDRCSLGSDFHCESSVVGSDGTVFLELYPLEHEMNISKVQCIYPDGSNKTEEFSETILDPGETVVLNACNGSKLSMSEKKKLSVRIIYARTTSDAFKHVAEGEIVQSVVEEEGHDVELAYIEADNVYTSSDGLRGVYSTDDIDPIPTTDGSCTIGHNCTGDIICVNGTCKDGCFGNDGVYFSDGAYNYSEDDGNTMMCCNGSEVNTSSDDDNCDGCDRSCGSDMHCEDSSCVEDSCTSGNDCNSTSCVEGFCEDCGSSDARKCSFDGEPYDESAGVCAKNETGSLFCDYDEVAEYVDEVASDTYYFTDCYDVYETLEDSYPHVDEKVYCDSEASDSVGFEQDGICAYDDGEAGPNTFDCYSSNVFIDDDERLRGSCEQSSEESLDVCDKEVEDSFEFDGICVSSGSCENEVCYDSGVYSSLGSCDPGVGCDSDVVEEVSGHDDVNYSVDGIVSSNDACVQDACTYQGNNYYGLSSGDCESGFACDDDTSDGSFDSQGIVGSYDNCLTGTVCADDGKYYSSLDECGQGSSCDTDVDENGFIQDGLVAEGPDKSLVCENDIVCRDGGNYFAESQCKDNMSCDDNPEDGFDEDFEKCYKGKECDGSFC